MNSDYKFWLAFCTIWTCFILTVTISGLIYYYMKYKTMACAGYEEVYDSSCRNTLWKKASLVK